MSIKKKLIISYILMAVVPVALISIAGGLFVFALMLADGMTVTDIKMMRFQEIILAVVFRYGMIWALISLVIIIASSLMIAFYISGSILAPLKELKTAAVNIKKGNLDYEVITSKDREINELCMAFEEMRLRLKDSMKIQFLHEEEKNMLIANISHDIRTPVTAIKGYAEGVLDGVADTPEKLSSYLKTIYLKAGVIDELVENLSLFSKLELKKLVFNFEMLDINKLIFDTLDICEMDLKQNNMTLECNLPNDEIIVNADGEKLKRVFLNIIDNAMKYKSNNEGVLTVSAIMVQKGVVIEFKDTGLGINANEAKHIFDGFYRADRSRNSEIKGNGLGLSIAKQMIDAHGGKIWVKSNEDKGITVYIFLPTDTIIR